MPSEEEEEVEILAAGDFVDESCQSVGVSQEEAAEEKYAGKGAGAADY